MGQTATVERCCNSGAAVTKANILDVTTVRKNRKKAVYKCRRSPGATLVMPYEVDWTKADGARWTFEEKTFKQFSYISEPEMEVVNGPIADGERRLRQSPHLYEGLKYQSAAKAWPVEQQSYSLVKRTGSGFAVTPTPQAQFTYVVAKYRALSRDVGVDPKLDDYTNGLTYQGRPLGVPRFPGRGQDCLDVPHLKAIGDVHPDDVSQGSVGDVWLLSAISALSEFDGAIARIFQRTPALREMPRNQLNRYVVTLFDMKTWTPVDIEVDERLCVKSDESGLLGCRPSRFGELWACYIEKAMAIHCGGWDQLDGGHCTHAWRMLTGSRDQYTFMNNGKGFECLGTMNPYSGEWEELDNSPQGGFRGLWAMPWPRVGGGGDIGATVGENEMFERMCAWDDQDYVMACSTKARADSDGGAVDGQAYTVLSCINNAGGTEFDLIKLRNPWGTGEFESKMWGPGGEGWTQYEKAAAICNPVDANDGVFWLERDEFFRYFKTVYLCACSMSEFTAA